MFIESAIVIYALELDISRNAGGSSLDFESATRLRRDHVGINDIGALPAFNFTLAKET